MKMGELCNRSVVIVEAGATVQEAARLMREHHVGSLVVVDRRGDTITPTAMVTDRDLVVGALANDGVEPRALAVSKVMSDSLFVAGENEDLYDVILRMRAKGIRRIPVVDAEGGLQGIFAFDDIVEYLSEQLESLSLLLGRERQHERSTRP